MGIMQDIVQKLDQGGGKFDFKKMLLMIADEIEVSLSAFCLDPYSPN